MRKIVNIGTFAFLLFAISGLASAQKAGELVPVKTLDIDRYAGRWFEIAKYPNKFQKQCISGTTATYTKKPNGKIEVLNECTKADGTRSSAKAEGKIADKSNNAKLKVRFAPGFTSFLQFVWANYWVIDLGADYEYAVVGEPKRDYLWILSRKPEMNDAEYQAIVSRIREMGYDPQRLVKTPQKG